jgi:acyl-CoA synthetase (NDP forming)
MGPMAGAGLPAEIARIEIESALAAGRTILDEIETKRILSALGIQVTMPELCRTPEQAIDAAKRIGFPVVLKLSSPDISHKSDAGGVALNLRTATEVRRAFHSIRRNLRSQAPRARFEGATVQPMVADGVEMLVGVSRDERFGALVTVGFGGVLVELIADTVSRLAPVDESEARAMIDGLHARSMLEGVRGRPPANVDALVALVVLMSELADRCQKLQELDLNPVVVRSDTVTVLDARAALKPASSPPELDRYREQRITNLRRAFAPRTVAVIGDKRTGGYMWLRALSKFRGQLYSVQIDPAEIPGIEAMGVENRLSVADLPGPIDYALSAVPRQVAPRILRDCIAAGVGAIAFFTSGFSETGEEIGHRLEAEILAQTRDSDIALIGPNCMGLCNPSAGLLNYAGLNPNDGGDVCFISQSGTHAINFCLQAASRGIKVHQAASIGNAIVLEAADYLELMAQDPATRVIGIYLEGLRDGRRFFESLRRATERCPVFILKGCVTEPGARATMSHTASLATPGSIWNAVVRQSGAATVNSLDEMLDAIELATRARLAAGRRLGLIAMTGGQSVVITDTFAAAGLEVPTLSAESLDELKSFFNIIGGSYRNPLDAGGTIGFGADLGQLARILDILERDPVIDSIALEIATGLRGDAWRANEAEMTAIIDCVGQFGARTTKPFATILHGAHIEDLVARARSLARARGIVVFESFERAAKAFAAVADSWRRRKGRSTPICQRAEAG